MSLPSLITTIFAQAANAAASVSTGTATGDAPAQSQQPPWLTPFMFVLFAAMIYFAMIRPQQQAKKKAEEQMKGVKTGDKVVTTGGIHGVVTNVKDTTVILKIADNVKIEIEKSHLDKTTRPESPAGSDKPVAAKA